MKTHTMLLENLHPLNPTYVQLINESMNHAGYFAGKESHFKLTIVSDVFEGLRRVARHQKIYSLVNELMTSQGGSVHALAIHAYSPTEWATMSSQDTPVPDSPLCAGKNTP